MLSTCSWICRLRFAFCFGCLVPLILLFAYTLLFMWLAVVCAEASGSNFLAVALIRAKKITIYRYIFR